MKFDLTQNPNLLQEALEQATDNIRSLALLPENKNNPPKILLLYGSLRKESYSHKLINEAEKLLKLLGCKTKIFDPSGLPTFDQDLDIKQHPKAQEIRDLFTWSEGQVWCSPEQHGSMTSVFKNQIDWIPLSLGGIRPTQHKTVALFQVSGGSQSFNTLQQMRWLARYMRMRAMVNQGTIPKAWTMFNKETGAMIDSPEYRRLVDVIIELVEDTYLTRNFKSNDTMRYSELVESPEELSKRVQSTKI